MTPLFFDNILVKVFKVSQDIDIDCNVFKGEEEPNQMIKETERK